MPLPAGIDPAEVAPHADAGITAYHAVKKLVPRLTPGATVAVIGVGGVGHIALQLLRVLGAASVIAVDTDERRRRLARELGATRGARRPAGRPGCRARGDERSGGRRRRRLRRQPTRRTQRRCRCWRGAAVYSVVGYGGTVSVPSVALIADEQTIAGNLVGSWIDSGSSCSCTPAVTSAAFRDASAHGGERRARCAARRRRHRARGARSRRRRAVSEHRRDPGRRSLDADRRRARALGARRATCAGCERERALDFGGLRRARGAGRSTTSRASGPRSGTSSRSGRKRHTSACSARATMPGAEWFPGARLNYAEHMLGRDEDVDTRRDRRASRRRASRSSSRSASCATRSPRRAPGLQRLGVGPGDRVVGYLPNIPETLVAFLAAASLGGDLGDLPAGVRRRAASSTASASSSRRCCSRSPATASASELDRPAGGGRGDPRAAAFAASGRPRALCRWARRTRCPDAVSWDALLAEQRAARVRAAAVRSSALRPLLVGHDGPAEGDRARARRHPARASEEPRARRGISGPATGCSGSRRPRG